MSKQKCDTELEQNTITDGLTKMMEKANPESFSLELILNIRNNLLDSFNNHKLSISEDQQLHYNLILNSLELRSIALLYNYAKFKDKIILSNAELKRH
jgi:hypothetical protein